MKSGAQRFVLCQGSSFLHELKTPFPSMQMNSNSRMGLPAHAQLWLHAPEPDAFNPGSIGSKTLRMCSKPFSLDHGPIRSETDVVVRTVITFLQDTYLRHVNHVQQQQATATASAISPSASHPPWFGLNNSAQR
eukprot:1244312-Amphidinium_carterae.1